MEVSLKPLLRKRWTEAWKISFRRRACSASVRGTPLGIKLLKSDQRSLLVYYRATSGRFSRVWRGTTDKRVREFTLISANCLQISGHSRRLVDECHSWLFKSSC